MCLIQIRPRDGFRGELDPCRLMPQTEHSSIVFDRSDGMPPLALFFLSAEPAAVALGRLPENRIDAA